MRPICKFVLAVSITCGAVVAQKLTPDFKFEGDRQPGDRLKITGTALDSIKAIKLKGQDGKPDISVPADSLKITPTEIDFPVPAGANGTYQVELSPGNGQPVPLTVTPKSSTGTNTPTDKPVIDSVFPTTTYPVQDHFSFEINGRNFSPAPEDDQVEVEGQGRIFFGSRYPSLSEDATKEAAKPIECNGQTPDKYPCLEVTSDGRRLLISGFPRRYPYQGPMRVRVFVKDTPSEFSSSFTLSRVDHRIIAWLTFTLFGLLMYLVYRLVSKGIQGYEVAGRKYSPIAAFLIDKSTDSYSLSKFQLFALSMVAFFGYVYVFLCRALVQWNFTFPEIPDNYPTLLAISAGTTAAAVGLNTTRGTKGAGPVYPSAADFISNGGLVVAERFQFFVWTLIACIGFIALVLMQDPAKVEGFPTLSNGLLYVMGVSAAGYLGGKAVRNPGPILKQVHVEVKKDSGGKATSDLSVMLKGENLDKQAKFRINGALQEVVGSVNGSEQPQGPQGYGVQLDFILSQGAGFAQGDHTFEIINRDGVAAQEIFTAAPMKVTGTPEITHGTTGPVTLTIQNYREGSTARWLAPSASAPVEIAASDVRKTGEDTVAVALPAGDRVGTGTLTLISPVGGTETTSVALK